MTLGGSDGERCAYPLETNSPSPEVQKTRVTSPLGRTVSAPKYAFPPKVMVPTCLSVAEAVSSSYQRNTALAPSALATFCVNQSEPFRHTGLSTTLERVSIPTLLPG